jgi:uncharacterized damage-inducible protein DinB
VATPRSDFGLVAAQQKWIEENLKELAAERVVKKQREAYKRIRKTKVRSREGGEQVRDFLSCLQPPGTVLVCIPILQIPKD